MNAVLDASALLAYIQHEPGSAIVSTALNDGALISTVNWAEVIQKAHAARVEIAGLASDLVALGLGLEPFTADQAEIAGGLWARTKGRGLSLADRSCLAVGLDKGLPVYTADRVWVELDLGIPITSIR
ncbi:MAG: type II toxin-antitoxin system VapC family toxin [Chromatiales bacterium]|nr:type II toxin-antitoxin system VapC family toxin [Chromatiales bacterium]